MKKIISFIVIISLVAAALPMYASAAQGENLAKGKEVWASDRYSDTYMPKNVNDGSTSTDWASGSVVMNGPSGPYYYVAIDLGMRYNITQIIARSRRDSDDGYTRNGWQVQLSNDRNFQEYVEVGKKTEAGPFKDDFVLNFDVEPQSYRYVRVAHETRTRMVISEIEVYGEPYMGEPRTEYTDTEGQLRDSTNILKYLGIMSGTDKNNFSKDLLLTRSEAVEVVLNTVNNKTVSDKALPYNDVSGEISGRIATALNLDILSRAEQFKPFDYVTVTEFAKMLLYASGYGELVKAKGGYPAGVISVANSLDWNHYTNQSWGDFASRETIANMVYAALATPVYETVAIGDEYFKNEKGEHLIERYFDLTLMTGVVTANCVTSLSEYNRHTDNFIEIDYNGYTDSNGVLREYIGRKIIFLTSKNSDNLIVEGFLLHDGNNTLSIKSRDIKAYSQGRITYYDEAGDEKTLMLEDDAAFIKNGVAKADITLADLKSPNASIDIVSSDDDKEAELIYLYAPTVVIPEYCVDNGDVLKLKGSNGVDIETQYDVVSYYKNGREVMAEQIYSNSLVYCYISENQKAVRIECFTGTVEGVVESLTDDTVTVNGTQYELSEYFTDVSGVESLGPSQEVVLIPDSEGRIVYKLEGDTFIGESYGIILGTSMQGLSSGKVRLFSDDNKFYILDAASKLKIDDSVSECTALDSHIGKVIIYSLNASGELARVYTEDGSSRKLVRETNTSSGYYYKNGVYTSQLETALMLFPVDTTATVFTVPYTNAAIATGTEYEKYYKAAPFSSSVTSGSSMGELIFYNVDTLGTPSLIIKKVNRSASDAAMIDISSPDNYYVERVGSAVSGGEDYVSLSVIKMKTGEKKKMLYPKEKDTIFRYDDMLRQGSMFVNDSERYLYKSLTSYGMQHLNEYEMKASELKAGDIIRGQVASGNASQFEAIDRIFTLDDFVKDISYVSYGDYGPTVKSQYILRCGTFGDISNGMFMLEVNSDSHYTFDYSNANLIVIENGETNVYSGSHLANYADSASKIVVYTGYGVDYAIVVYK